MPDLSSFETNRDHLEAYGYRILPWEEFVIATDRPDGLLERAVEETSERDEVPDWIVYDPDGDAQDWMLVGDREEIAHETVLHIVRCDPPTGPLSRGEMEASTAPRR